MRREGGRGGEERRGGIQVKGVREEHDGRELGEREGTSKNGNDTGGKKGGRYRQGMGRATRQRGRVPFVGLPHTCER